MDPTRLLCPWDSPGQEYWNGLPFLSPGDLPNPGIKPGSPALLVDSSQSEPPGNPNLYMEIKLIGITLCYFIRISLFRSSWKMQLLSTLVWLLALQMNQLIFPPSFFQQTFIMWLFWLQHCAHCWIHSQKRKSPGPAFMLIVYRGKALCKGCWSNALFLQRNYLLPMS